MRAVEANLDEAGRYPHLSFLQVEPATLVVTCVKKAERDESLIVRLYNISDQPAAGQISAYKPISKAKQVNLNEEPVEELPITDGGQIEIEVPSRRILTVALQFA